MNKLKELQQRAKALRDEGDALRAKIEAEKRDFTPEELTRAEQITTELAETTRQLQIVIDHEKWMATRADSDIDFIPGVRSLDDVESRENRKDYNGWPVAEADQFLMAVYSRGLNGSLPSGMHPELRETFLEAVEKRAPTGQNTIVDSEGGFAVPSTLASTILQKISEEGKILSRTQSVPITVGNGTEWNAVKENARTSGNRYGGITVARVGEGGEITASKAKTDRVKVELKKLAALVYMTEEQLADGPQMRTVVESLVPKAFTFKIEDEMINGDGVTQMQGILNMPALVSVAKETGQAAATILYENIVKMYSRQHMLSGEAVWLINQDVLPSLFTMSIAVGTGGIPVYLPANGAAGAPFGTLMGRPLIPVEQSKTLGTKGDILLVNLSQYLYAFKGGMRSDQSIHVKFTTDEVAFRFIMRNDGKSWWPLPLTPANGTNTQSPFVALDTRA